MHPALGSVAGTLDERMKLLQQQQIFWEAADGRLICNVIRINHWQTFLIDEQLTATGVIFLIQLPNF